MSPSADDQPSARPGRGPGAALSPEELEARLRGPGELTEADLDALDAWYRSCEDPADVDPADVDPAGEDPDGFDPDVADPDGFDPAGEDPAGEDPAGEDPAGEDPAGEDPGCGPDAGPGGAARPVVPEIFEAGFVHRYPVEGATGFAPGGPLDRMLPGADLAWHLGNARKRGLGALSDDELIGVLVAARRVQSWQAELELAATAELDVRRAFPDGREGEHVDDEVAAALRLTGRAAQTQLELARQMGRLPCTAALLAAGIMDRRRAEVIASHLSLLPDDQAAAVDAAVAVKAGEQTTGELGAACQRKVIACDPEAYERRKKKAEDNARVECWDEPSGTGAIAGRDLDRARVINADKSIDAAARWLAAHGMPGTMDQLRGEAFLGRLCGQSLESLLSDCPAGQPGPAGRPDPADPGPVPAGLNRINLTEPLSTWLELTNRPGEISGTGAGGPADAATCRQLTDILARSPKTRWCITLTDPAGRAVAHGCARAGPGPPGSDKRAWLASVKITPIQTGGCAHPDETHGYRPAPKLRHKVKIRSPRCGFPGCRRSAWRCDDDHTIPYHQGGRTCECNVHPLCRYHHQAKQAPGWHLAQPEPGVLIWTTPSGRTYTVTPEPYPV